MQKDKVINFLTNFNLLILGNFIFAFAFAFLQVPTKINTGGSSGIGQILGPLLNVNTSLIIFIFSVVTLVFGLIFLDAKSLVGAITGSIVYPLFIEMWQGISNLIYINTTDLLLVSTFLAILIGLANGLIYKSGFGSHGVSIISQIVFKYRKISITTSNLVLNSIIIIIGGYYNGLDVVIYAIYILYLSKIVTDRVLLGISKSKKVYIATTKRDEVIKYLNDTLNTYVYTIDIESSSITKSSKLLLATVNTKDYYLLSEGIKEIDKYAYFVTTDTYQTSNNSKSF